METVFVAKCEILADLWMSYREDAEFSDFVSYNDLGLPLAYLISTELVQPSEAAKEFVNEAWNLLLAALEVEDRGFDSLDDLFAEAE